MGQVASFWPNLTPFSLKDGFCLGRAYLKKSAGGALSAPDAAEVPAAVKAALDAQTWAPTKKCDGRYLGPPAPAEEPCFACPGPAPSDARLYCTRTVEGTWVGWRWYRFVDQPEMNQVFASLPADERDAARCFMQARIPPHDCGPQELFLGPQEISSMHHRYGIYSWGPSNVLGGPNRALSSI
jgi:hypothetical protein